MAVTFVSTLTFVLSTFEELQVQENEEPSYPLVVQIIDMIDITVVAIFTIEYLTRLLCSPRRLKFFLKPMNFAKLSLSPSQAGLR